MAQPKALELAKEQRDIIERVDKQLFETIEGYLSLRKKKEEGMSSAAESAGINILGMQLTGLLWIKTGTYNWKSNLGAYFMFDDILDIMEAYYKRKEENEAATKST